MLLVVTVFVSSCRKNAKEKRTERIMEKTGGENVDIDLEKEGITIETSIANLPENSGLIHSRKDILE